MECREAQSLIDAGVRPGSTNQQRKQLGFHIAQCAECRAYLARITPLARSRVLIPPAPTTLGTSVAQREAPTARPLEKPVPAASPLSPDGSTTYADGPAPHSGAPTTRPLENPVLAPEVNPNEHDASDLLTSLLMDSPEPPPPLRRRRGVLPPNRRPPPWLTYVVISLLGALALSLGFTAGRVARAAYTIRENVTAMQVAPAAPRAVTPALVVPPESSGFSGPTSLATTDAVATEPFLPSPTPTPAVDFAATEIAIATALALMTPSSLPIEATAVPYLVPSLEPDAGIVIVPSPTTEPAPPDLSPTPIRLPTIDGTVPLPTLIPTINVVPASTQPQHILLLGSDRRPGEGWQNRSDAIMIVRVEPDTQRIALLSLPRDLIVEIPGYGWARINAMTAYSNLDPGAGSGIELARRTVSNLLDLPIDYVVRADFQAFMTAIDAIGGIEINVETELYDPMYPTIDYGYMVAHFLPGPQSMDGYSALIYSRIRHPDSDYARSRRQQEVIQAIMSRVRDQNIIVQAQMLSDLSTALRDHLVTDFSLEEMIGLAWAFRNFSPEDVERYTLDENLTTVGLPGDQYAITTSSWALQLVRSQLVGQ
ncbi:LCP family protein [Candidatus Chloroploca sp. M-50]|uniref:LCP family protein n=1 Tax=Candidatus Chloroploca mongolica TaxID=2528176 RepID=A0ABS4D8K2_9CHLR|nr:LCP family protein [Candidatus Chloroploca mongolica]MBP1465761.1 LCP family protein [Candidatus Chloroploca mongolica]